MRVFDEIKSDEELIERLKKNGSSLDLSDQALFLRICQAAMLRCELVLLTALLPKASRENMRALLDFARTAERPARYGYLEVLRKAGLSYPIDQGTLNPKMVAYVGLKLNEHEIQHPREARQRKVFLDRVRKIRGFCNGWSFVEFALTAKNLGLNESFDLWLEAAKFELFSWDEKRESLDEALNLPQSAPMTRGELFERIVGMVLAHQGDYPLGGDESVVTQAALRDPGMSPGFGGMEMSLQGSIMFFKQEVSVFTKFGPEGLKKILENARFVEVIENGIMTFAANNHVIYLAAYRNPKGELCYQLFDANCSVGRLSTKRLSFVVAKIPDMLRVTEQTSGTEIKGFALVEEKTAAPKEVSKADAELYRACTAEQGFTAQSLFAAALRNDEEWFLSMLPCFGDIYRRVVNTVIPVSNSDGTLVDVSILAALIRSDRASLIPMFLRELHADANLKTPKGQTAIFYAFEARNIAAIANLLYASNEQNIQSAVDGLPLRDKEWIFDTLLPKLKEILIMPIQGFDEAEDKENNLCHPDMLSLVAALRVKYPEDPRLSDYPAGDTVMRYEI